MWQNIIVGACVIAAVLFLARQWIPGLGKPTPGCGGCKGCSDTTTRCGNPADKSTP